MAQISRPFQIGLVVVVLLAAVWLFALQGHSSSPSSGSSASSSPVVTSSVSPSSTPTHGGSQAHPSTSKAGAQTQHGTVPTSAHHAHPTGVEGLLHAVNKAHEAAATAQQNANQVERKSREASNESAPAQASHASTPASGATTASTPASGAGAPTTSTTHAAPGATSASSAASATTGTGAHGSASTIAVPTGQREVEAELKQGKIAVLLFWNPAGSDDVVVHNELRLLLRLHTIAGKAKAEEFRHAEKFFGLELAKKIVVHEALASQVTSYGSITRGIQIYGTPTILVINPRGQAIVLTGITDAYSIEQAIEEARAAAEPSH
jgi:cytoskeletal protein RodZ